jgi:hypothetical protein
MSLKKLKIAREDWVLLRSIQGAQRADCQAAFTVTPSGQIWPFRSNGNTPEDFREVDARGTFDFLDQMADELLPRREFGGRFLVNDTGAYYRLGKGQADVQFIEFEFIVE